MTQSTQTTGWYVSRGQKKWGPYSGKQLKSMAVAGKLLQDDLVWKQGLASWVPAKQVPGLFAALPASAPSLPSSLPDVGVPSPSRTLGFRLALITSLIFVSVFLAVLIQRANSSHAAHQQNLENALTQLRATSKSLAVAASKLRIDPLDRSDYENNKLVRSMRQAIDEEQEAAEALILISKLYLLRTDESIFRKLAPWDFTGSFAKMMGLPQEAAATSELFESFSRQVDAARRLGRLRLKYVMPSEIKSAMALVRASNARIAKLIQEGCAASDIDKARAEKAESLYKHSQTFAVLRESGVREGEALATIYSVYGNTIEEKRRRHRVSGGRDGTGEDRVAAVLAAKMLLAEEAESELKALKQ